VGEWRELEISRATGAEKVEAEVNGPFGLHPSVETPGRWALTHVATGLRFPLFETRGEAVRCHRAVSPLDFGFESQDAMPRETKLECARIYREITGREPVDRPTITIKED